MELLHESGCDERHGARRRCEVPRGPAEATSRCTMCWTPRQDRIVACAVCGYRENVEAAAGLSVSGRLAFLEVLTYLEPLAFGTVVGLMLWLLEPVGLANDKMFAILAICALSGVQGLGWLVARRPIVGVMLLVSRPIGMWIFWRAAFACDSGNHCGDTGARADLEALGFLAVGSILLLQPLASAILIGVIGPRRPIDGAAMYQLGKS